MPLFLANLLWFLSALPDLLLFVLLLPFPHAAQRLALRRRTASGAGEILFHEPTSGTTGPTKWIPFTPALKREFLAGINPWIALLFLRHPGLFWKKQYWSVSPVPSLRIPDGIKLKPDPTDDASYLSPLQRRVSRTIFCAPHGAGSIADPEKHAFLTLLAMLSARDLGLISMWHPSYLLILLDRAAEMSGKLAGALKTGDWGDGRTHEPAPDRAGEVLAALERRDFAALWRHLRVISCWDQARAAGDAARLRSMFPRVDVQGKGLLATEGIVTLTWPDGRHVAASLSHTLHFRAYSESDDSSANDELIPLDRVRKGGVYTVFLSTGNGSELYPLNDVVLCTGFLARNPCFDFLYRSGGVCDLRGEKLHTGQAERLIAELERKFSLFSFAMLIPSRTLDRYVFLYDSESPPDQIELADAIETILKRNIYYNDARYKGQLKPVEVRFRHGAMESYRALRAGISGGVKPPPLFLPPAIPPDARSSDENNTAFPDLWARLLELRSSVREKKAPAPK